MENWRTRFRDRYSELKKINGLTQEKLAQKLGVRQSSISNWLNGHREPESLEDFQALADALGVSLGWLMAGHTTADPSVNELLEILPKLDDSQVEALLAVARSLSK